MSKELTHFVGKGKAQEEQYQLLLTILRSGELRADPNCAPGTRAISGRTTFGAARFSERQTYHFPGVCFCDIPLADLEIHARKFSCFGIAFRRRFLVDRGASPVFYIARDSPISPAPCDRLGIENREYTRGGFFDAIFPRVNGLCNALVQQSRALAIGNADTPNELVGLAQGIAEMNTYLTEYVYSYCVPFDANSDDADGEHFYMEREWRVLGDVQFVLRDVERLIAPRAFGERIRHDLLDFCGQTYFLDL